MSSSMHIPICFVDAFTINDNEAFTGNPAAVCLLEYDDDISDDIKQKIANEVNLSDTAFVSYGWRHGEKLAGDEDSSAHRRTLRWFTPSTEVELCGHATVASAKALTETQLANLVQDKDVKMITISFESKFRGKLGATFNKENGRITLNFPANPCHPLNNNEHTAWLGEMISTTLGEDVSEDSIADIQFSHGTKILLLRLKDQEDHPEKLLAKVSPDYRKLEKIKTGNLPVGIIVVTVKGESVKNDGEAPHFYSRLFAPLYGIDEDPVTGMAHTTLTPYWFQEHSEALEGENFAIDTLFGRQHSKRGGNLFCTLAGDRVNIAGEARVTIKGQLFI